MYLSTRKNKYRLVGILVFILIVLLIMIPKNGYIDINCKQVQEVKLEKGAVGKSKSKTIYRVRIEEGGKKIIINSDEEVEITEVYNSIVRCADSHRIYFESSYRNIFLERLVFIK